MEKEIKKIVFLETQKKYLMQEIEKNPQQINSWFNYLMGYIKAIDESLTS